MEGVRRYSSSSIPSAPSLHTLRHARRTALNYVFAAVYSCAVVVLLYHQAHRLVHSTTLASFFISLSLFLADTVLAFMWTTRQCFLVNIVYRDEHPGNLEEVLKKSNFPALDVFICTADPYKEPPMRLVSTALSVMAYDYPTEKISVYVSDDGGSQVTLFACMEAVKFASYWLPFCRKHNTAHRSPEAYFASNHSCSSDSEQIKVILCRAISYINFFYHKVGKEVIGPYLQLISHMFSYLREECLSDEECYKTNWPLGIQVPGHMS